MRQGLIALGLVLLASCGGSDDSDERAETCAAIAGLTPIVAERCGVPCDDCKARTLAACSSSKASTAELSDCYVELFLSDCGNTPICNAALQ